MRLIGMNDEYEKAMIQEMDEAVNPESRKAIESKYQGLVDDDVKLAEEYATQLAQTKRNAQQGELGQ
jgi:hypothetical protein